MNLWLAMLGATGCALAGVVLGRWFSRLRSPYWMLLADPLSGVAHLSYAEFAERWRFVGITLHRTGGK